MTDILDLHEVVLDVHVSFGRALRERCGQIEADEIVGMGVSNDAVKGRVLINIAGSRSTVKHGREAVIKLLASDARYKEGDIRLRRIEGQSVDTAGFQEARPVRKEDAYGCKEPFDWERYAWGTNTRIQHMDPAMCSRMVLFHLHLDEN